jgi:hypothetical protein
VTSEPMDAGTAGRAGHRDGAGGSDPAGTAVPHAAVVEVSSRIVAGEPAERLVRPARGARLPVLPGRV